MKEKSQFKKLADTLRSVRAALGSCPKCGYGFAGKKPENGKMVKLSPEDPKFDPTKPCPNCELGLDDRGSGKEDATADSWYIELDVDRGGVHLAGPFPDEEHALSRVDDLKAASAELHFWDNGGHMSRENCREDVSSFYTPLSPSDFKELQRQIGPDKINVKPVREVLNDFKEEIEEVKRENAKELVENLPKEPNVASLQGIIKFADKIKSQKLLFAATSKKKKKDFSHLAKNPVVSKELFEAHLGLYEGYVKALNTILDKLEEVSNKDNGYSYGEYSELKRRLAVPHNGAMLHELYFEHLEPQKEVKPSKELSSMLKERWGSVNNYLNDVRSTALAAGNGWVITVFDPTLEQLDNYLITEHHIGLPVGCTPIMVLDMFEHSYYSDFLSEKNEYIDKFFENLDFGLLELRLGKKETQDETT